MASRSQIRVYRSSECIAFRSTKSQFGGLSNMAGGFPLCISGISVLSAEALYQAARYPHRPELQKLILSQRSPMTAKMVGRPFCNDSRQDWMRVRVSIMRWVLRVKLAAHWDRFGELLLATGDRPIVEDSRQDDFWGAFRDHDELFIGVNALGRLLMELRQERRHLNRALFVVNPPAVPGFLILSKEVDVVTSIVAE